MKCGAKRSLNRLVLRELQGNPAVVE
ncbi:MAG: hypothetical protein JWM68_4848, partial [Verrucomicrobiales bacterium]|nr:hypothetical protein [Verrucomicrobiales bacterium]